MLSPSKQEEVAVASLKEIFSTFFVRIQSGRWTNAGLTMGQQKVLRTIIELSLFIVGRSLYWNLVFRNPAAQRMSIYNASRLQLFGIEEKDKNKNFVLAKLRPSKQTLC